jgi:retron-type reverse transcriptase
VKRYGNLFSKITAFDNLLLAAKKAQKGKRFKAAVARFNLNLEKELVSLQDDLKAGAYRHGSYHDFFVFDPKMRLISAAPYRDRVVHHALCNIIEPIFDKSFIDDSYACRRGRGTHKAVDRYTAFARRNRFVLKCDIRKYFQSIDHQILLSFIARKIKCPDTLRLIETIVGTRADKTHITYFSGDDIFTPYNREKGIPIGNLTSQFFANIYLDGFDHAVKERLKCRHYIRYVDDFVAFHNDKTFLHDLKSAMERHLENLRLRLHPKKSRIYRVTEGVRFLGYRVFPDHRLLDKANVLRMRRKLKQMAQQYADGEISLEKMNGSIQSWIGHAGHADTWMLRKRLLGGVDLFRGRRPRCCAAARGTTIGTTRAAPTATGTTRTTGTTMRDSVAPVLEP